MLSFPVSTPACRADHSDEGILTLSFSIREIARAAALLLLCALIAAVRAVAQSTVPDGPQVGQRGKDVIWVPSTERAAERMLAMAQVGPDDLVIDLGSGDGRIVIMAAQRFGARALGVELNPELVKLSEQRAKQAGVAARARFELRDIFETDLKPATVVTLYLLSELNLRLRPSLLRLAPGTRIVANAFDMGEWEADQFDDTTPSLLRLWIVPARVSGHWRWSLATGSRMRQLEMELNQQFQRVSGVVSSDQQHMRLRDARLRGDDLRFTVLEQQRADVAVRYDYAGRVYEDRIEGEVVINESNNRMRWTATRKMAGVAAR